MSFNANFKLSFLAVLLRVSISCGINNCADPILLDENEKCCYNLKEFISEVHVNASTSRTQYFSQSQLWPESQRQTSFDYLRLTAHPLLTYDGYKASFCMSMLVGELLTTKSILLEFTTRFGGRGTMFHRSQVWMQIIYVKNCQPQRYYQIGCYWHYEFLMPRGAQTVELNVMVRKENGTNLFSKFCFRLPHWGIFNGQTDVDSCLFEPFVYAEERETVDVVTVTRNNCFRTANIEIEQVDEQTEQLLESKMIIGTDVRVTMIGHKLLYFYRASAREINDLDDSGLSNFLILGTLALIIGGVVLLWVLVVLHFVFTSKKSNLFLETKPVVKFLYCKADEFKIYRTQVEALIMFLKEYCNIAVEDDIDSIQLNLKCEKMARSLLQSDKIFQVVVLIPFPPVIPNSQAYEEPIAAPENLRGSATDYILLEMPFWTTNYDQFLCKTAKKRWKRFKMMDEIFPFIKYVQRKRSLFQKRFVSDMGAERLREELERLNLTNDCFLWCLQELKKENEYSTDLARVKVRTDFVDLQKLDL